MPDPMEHTAPAPSRDDLRAQMSRVIEQYLKLDSELRQVENTNFRVCIFGSARIRRSDPTYEMVYNLAKSLSGLGMDIVTGGGPGLMEAANRAVMDVHSTNSKSYGLPLDIPTLREPANRHLDIKSAHQRFSSRLDEFIRLSHAVVVAPGGIGTLLELTYIWQLLQIGLVERRPAILLGSDFWGGLLNWMQASMVTRAFVNPEDLDVVRIVDDIDEVVDILQKEQEEYLRSFRNGHIALPGGDSTQE